MECTSKSPSFSDLRRAIIGIFLALVPAAHAGKIYWTDRAARLVQRADMDGQNVETIADFSDVRATLRGIALHGDTIFLADNANGKILALEGKTRRELLTGLSFPADLTLDHAARKMYWCDYTGNKIQRANFDGSGLEVLLDTSAPYFLDLDLKERWLYWGDYDKGNIQRMKLDGGGTESIVSGQRWVRSVNLDLADSMIYWCDREAHGIFRRKIAGGEPELLYGGLDTPHGMVLDIPARKMYWADTGTNRVEGSLGAKAISRGDMDKRGNQEVLLPLREPWDVDLDLGTHSYEEWRARYLPKDMPAKDAAPEADPDGDGASNLLEYALGTHPERKEARPITEAALPEGRLFRFHRPREAKDLLYRIEISTNKTDWRMNRYFGEIPTDSKTYAGKVMQEGVSIYTLAPKLLTGETYMGPPALISPAEHEMETVTVPIPTEAKEGQVFVRVSVTKDIRK